MISKQFRLRREVRRTAQQISGLRRHQLKATRTLAAALGMSLFVIVTIVVGWFCGLIWALAWAFDGEEAIGMLGLVGALIWTCISPFAMKRPLSKNLDAHAELRQAKERFNGEVVRLIGASTDARDATHGISLVESDVDRSGGLSLGATGGALAIVHDGRREPPS